MDYMSLMATSIATGLILMVFMCWKLVLWARKRSTGAIVTGALFSVFAPDPTFEQTVRLVEIAGEESEEKDPGGEPGRDDL
jgi:hypothetical protein